MLKLQKVSVSRNENWLAIDQNKKRALESQVIPPIPGLKLPWSMVLTFILVVTVKMDILDRLGLHCSDFKLHH